MILNTVVSILLANKGLSAILHFSIPMLMLLYPLTIVIILLALTDKLFGGGRIVYFCTMMAALMVGLLDAYKAAFGLDAETAAAIERIAVLQYRFRVGCSFFSLFYTRLHFECGVEEKA